MAQDLLFDCGTWWEKHWHDMPEFHQIGSDVEPYQTVQVHFSNESDVNEFGEKLGKLVSKQTKYLWYPGREENDLSAMLWIDSDE